MKKTFNILLAASLFCTTLMAQSINTAFVASIENTASQILKDQDTFKKVVKVQDEHNSSVYYYNGDQLQLIVVEVKGGAGPDKKVEWYFKNNELIFSHQVWTDAGTRAVVDDQKFYLENKHLVHWTKMGVTIDPLTDEFKALESRLLSYGDKLVSGK